MYTLVFYFIIISLMPEFQYVKKVKLTMVDKLILQFWPSYKEFDVVHDYLVTPNNKMQARLRKRGQNGVY